MDKMIDRIVTSAILNKSFIDKNARGDSKFVGPENKAPKISNFGERLGSVGPKPNPFRREIESNRMVVLAKTNTAPNTTNTKQTIAIKRKPATKSTNKCEFCENMAKNFLYLENLLREKADPKRPCTVCDSSLKYLQYVNRSIKQVFGTLDLLEKPILGTAAVGFKRDFGVKPQPPKVVSNVGVTVQPKIAMKDKTSGIKKINRRRLNDGASKIAKDTKMDQKSINATNDGSIKKGIKKGAKGTTALPQIVKGNKSKASTVIGSGKLIKKRNLKIAGKAIFKRNLTGQKDFVTNVTKSA